MKILALDLGTKTGYALEASNYPLSCGTFMLGGPVGKNLDGGAADMRFFRLIGWLEGICLGFKPEVIAYEDVQFVKSRIQAHLWATWRAAVWLSAWKHSIKVICCPTSTLKKFAAGNGAADKAEMASALCNDPRFQLARGFPTDTVTGSVLDDNACDAIHLLRWAQFNHEQSSRNHKRSPRR